MRLLICLGLCMPSCPGSLQDFVSLFSPSSCRHPSILYCPSCCSSLSQTHLFPPGLQMTPNIWSIWHTHVSKRGQSWALQGECVPDFLLLRKRGAGLLNGSLSVVCNASSISPSPHPDRPRCQGRQARAPRGDLPALPLQLLPLLLAAGLEYSWQQKISTVYAWHWRQINFLEVPVALFSSHSKSSLALPCSTCLLHRPADSLAV